jgi:superfamily II DNA/RNA helicase
MEAYYIKKKKSFSRRPSFGARPHRSGNGGGYGSANGGNTDSRRRFSASPRRGRGIKIDPAKFVNKAVTAEIVAAPAPECKFSDFEINKQLAHMIEGRGYTHATSIQTRTIPHILKGKDVVGIADTGTGKTAAFLIPLINKAMADRQFKVLIVAPTRELAVQINQELKEFSKGLHIYSACCVGGANISRQIYELRQDTSFIIGTPGRLKDLVERKRINPAKFGAVVLDEADRMLDMGFITDIRSMLELTPKTRQTLFFSATLSHEIEKLIGEFLREPERVFLKTRDTSSNVEQDVIRVANGKSKIETLHGLLSQKGFEKVLIFGRTKYGVEHLYETLTKRGFKAESIHGNKNFSRRQRALELFKTNRVQILVATDVAARGLDIADITHVINFDVPETYEDYIHRIGRTGRGDKFGKALTFIE